MKNIAVLMTCHNRKDKSIACLERLFAQSGASTFSLHVILVDDGSTDQTAEAVSKKFPYVEILEGDGKLFWNRGMHLAFSYALPKQFDAYLWLNDDTMLNHDAVSKLLAVWKTQLAKSGRDCICVGSTVDCKTGKTTYGGMKYQDRNVFFRRKLELVSYGTELAECDTMNGNCVLIPHSVAVKLGNLDLCFAHAMGDLDYGFRARKLGTKIFVIDGEVGSCSKNSIPGTYKDRSKSKKERWGMILQPTGLPPKSWFAYTRKYEGIMWPIHWIWPYFKILLQ